LLISLRMSRLNKKKEFLLILRFVSLCATESDPFYESKEEHNLIGVANMYMEVLLYDGVKLNYNVPIISQQGEVSRNRIVKM